MTATTTEAATAEARSTERVRTHYVEAEDGRLVLVPGDPTRATAVAGWICWHVPELAGVLVPAGVAVAVSPWAWVVSAAVATGWAACALRRSRQQAAIRAGRDISAAPDSTPDRATDSAAKGTSDATEDTAADPAPVASAAGGDEVSSDVPVRGGGVWL